MFKHVKKYIRGNLLSIVVGIGLGLFLFEYPQYNLFQDIPIKDVLLSLLYIFAAVWLSIIIHEAGHLVAGLLTGYRFVSFRIGSLMLVKRHNDYIWKRFSIMGTGGQCLMAPQSDQLIDQPYFLYHLGGVLANLTSSLLAYVTQLNLSPSSVKLFMIIFAVIGLLLGLTNAIPLNVDLVTNDGMNLILLGKDPQARASFNKQLLINEGLSHNIRLKDLPQEWFELPDDYDKTNIFHTSINIFKMHRLIDSQQYDQAVKFIDELLASKQQFVGIHEAILKMEALFFKLIHNNQQANIDYLEDIQVKKFMQGMPKFPTTLRLQFAKALLYNMNHNVAQSHLEKFNIVAKTYPNEGDIEYERDLINLALRHASSFYSEAVLTQLIQSNHS